jgi:hypothetical protein
MTYRNVSIFRTTEQRISQFKSHLRSAWTWCPTFGQVLTRANPPYDEFPCFYEYGARKTLQHKTWSEMREMQKEIYIHIKLRLARYTNHSLSKNQKFKCPQIFVVMETCAPPRKHTTGLHSESVLQYSSHHTHLFRKKVKKRSISKVFFYFYCTVHLDNIKITFTNECTFYLTYKMLKFIIKTSMHLPVHVSFHLDHLQGAYGDLC